MSHLIHHTLRRAAGATAPAAPSGADPAAAARAAQAFVLLRTLFVVAPIAFGLDKFLGLLTDWDAYLAPWINDLVPGSAHQAMLLVGVIEVVAGLAVAVNPRWGALVVAAWLGGIIVDLVTLGDYYDVALRDVGLLVAAVSLSLLAPRPGRTAGGGTR